MVDLVWLEGGILSKDRFDLTDEEWAVIAPLLPNKLRGALYSLRLWGSE